MGEALDEDIPGGDVTTEALFLPETREDPRVDAEVAYVPREAGTLCGIPVLEEMFREHAPDLDFEALAGDGTPLLAGKACARVRGRLVDILRLERVSLNFLQRLSGIATETRRWVDELAGTAVTLLDTRKTTPGWRLLEKYAVRVGGGANHRGSLSDAFLLKDNHAEALRSLVRGGIPAWVARMRSFAPGLVVEVEVASRAEVEEAIAAEADIVLLDNFSPEDLRWAVALRDRGRRRDRRGRRLPLLEASGGIRPSTLRDIAATGIDRISVGYLTHSARALDVGLDLVEVSTSRGSTGTGC